MKPSLIYDSKILIVDDSEFSIFFITEILGQANYKNLRTSGNGKEALEITKSWKPNLVILDLMLPEMNGFEYCDVIRSMPEFSNMSIIVQTGLTEVEKRLEVFKRGVSDLLIKPINAAELVSRVALHLERKALTDELNNYKLRMEEELERAREMQNFILPTFGQKLQLEKKYKITIGDYFKSSFEIGGDIWGFRPLSDNLISIYTIDFSGHGISAALNTFRMHAIIESIDRKTLLSPGDTLTAVNEKLKDLLMAGQFATMFYGIIDRDINRLFYTSAASTPVILFSKKSESQYENKLIESNAMPIGIELGAEYKTLSVDLSAGDYLFLYSDALIETANAQNKFFTDKDITKIILDNISSKIHNSKIVENIVEKFFDFVEDKTKISDDLTLNLYHLL